MFASAQTLHTHKPNPYTKRDKFMHMLLKIKAGNGKRHRIFPSRQWQSMQKKRARELNGRKNGAANSGTHTHTHKERKKHAHSIQNKWRKKNLISYEYYAHIVHDTCMYIWSDFGNTFLFILSSFWPYVLQDSDE